MKHIKIDCKHFKQHYILFEQKLYRVECGHCEYKPSKISCKDCPHYCKGFDNNDEAKFNQSILSYKLLCENKIEVELSKIEETLIILEKIIGQSIDKIKKQKNHSKE